MFTISDNVPCSITYLALSRALFSEMMLSERHQKIVGNDDLSSSLPRSYRWSENQVSVFRDVVPTQLSPPLHTPLKPMVPIGEKQASLVLLASVDTKNGRSGTIRGGSLENDVSVESKIGTETSPGYRAMRAVEKMWKLRGMQQ